MTFSFPNPFRRAVAVAQPAAVATQVPPSVEPVKIVPDLRPRIRVLVATLNNEADAYSMLATEHQKDFRLPDFTINSTVAEKTRHLATLLSDLLK